MITFYFLIVAHFIADYFLQFFGIGENKQRLNKFMLIHGITAGIAFFIPLINYPAGKTLLFTFILIITHIIIDILKVEINRISNLNPTRWLYLALTGLDQIAHITVIYFLYSNLIG